MRRRLEKQTRYLGGHVTTVRPQFAAYYAQGFHPPFFPSLMDSPYRLLHLGRFITQPPRPAALEALPAELIAQIADYLPPSSVALLSLAIADYILYSARDVGRVYIRATLSIASKHVFCRRWTETYRRLYCFYCHKLHTLRKHKDGLGAEELFRRVTNSWCMRSAATYNCGTTNIHHAGFRFEHVQMAMKLHRLGLFSDAKAFLMSSALLRPACRRMTDLPANLGLFSSSPDY